MMAFGLLMLQAECWVLDQLCQIKLLGWPRRPETDSQATRRLAVGP